jgi:hypothetical protein
VSRQRCGVAVGPEQLRVDVGFEQRGAIHHNKRPVGARRRGVKRAGGPRFSHTRLAPNADALDGGRNLGNQVADAANRAAAAGEVRQPMMVTQLLPEPVVFRQQPTALGDRE